VNNNEKQLPVGYYRLYPYRSKGEKGQVKDALAQNS
jgi:hypothetical protein